MRLTLALLVASTALMSAIGLPALAMMRRGDDPGRNADVLFDDSARSAWLFHVSGDDTGDGDSVHHAGYDRDDDGDGGDDGCLSAENGTCPGPTRNPVPSGKAAPPANGLFGGGKPPVAVMK